MSKLLNGFSLCRQQSTDKQIQQILFQNKYPSGSEDENLEDADCEEEYIPPQRQPCTDGKSSTDSEDEV